MNGNNHSKPKATQNSSHNFSGVFMRRLNFPFYVIKMSLNLYKFIEIRPKEYKIILVK